MHLHLNLLTLALFTTVTNGIQSPLTFVAKPSGSVAKTTYNLLHVRGGADVDVDETYSIEEADVVDQVDELVETEKSQEVSNSIDDATTAAITEEEMSTPETVPSEYVETVPVEDLSSSTVNRNILLTLLTPFDNLRKLYMNSLRSHPVPTIIISVVLISLFVWNVINFIQEKSQGKEANDETDQSVVQISEQQRSSVRGLLTGVGTAAATTYAIYQVMNRPCLDDEQSLNTTDELEEKDDDSTEESSASVFKGV